MVRTCHKCHGCSEDYDEVNLRRCAGCRKVFYCSTACQKYDWVAHIFDCKPKRPINTADYLVLAVRENLFPEYLQTCKDYGFNRAATMEEKTNLFSLYIGTYATLFKVGSSFSNVVYALAALLGMLKVPPKTTHDWCVRGVLIDEIKAAFYELPEGYRGGYFPWFL